MHIQELAACTRAVVSPADLALPGRTTGSEDWRRARGEDGATSTTGSGAPSGNAGSGDGAGAGGALKGGTPYVSAGDAALPPLFVSAGRLVGGAVRAAGHNGPGETAVQAFDGKRDSV